MAERYKSDILNESKFGRVFAELSEHEIAAKTHEQFVKEYLSDTLFFYNATDSTKIELREKPLKANKELKAAIELKLEEQKRFELLNLQKSSDIRHYNQRSMVERVNKLLKDDFGCNTIYYKKSYQSSLDFSIWYFIHLYPSEFEAYDMTL